MTLSEPLTREQILSEPAGPRMDVWVAERVMGMERLEAFGAPGFPTVLYINANQYVRGAAPRFSRDMSEAWRVVEKMGRDRVCFSIEVESCDDGRPLAHFFTMAHTSTEHDVSAFGDTAPLAICRAALLATVGK